MNREQNLEVRAIRPRRYGRVSVVSIILLAVGGAMLLIGLVCGGIMYVGYRKALELKREAAAREEAAAEARRAEADRRLGQIEQNVRPADPDPWPKFPPVPPDFPNPFVDPPPAEPPPPKPGFKEADDPPPQPRATAFATDDVENPDRWRVLFRSKKPDLWNTNTQAGEDFAIPLRSTPKDTKYLRLRRMDTGEAIIVPMTRARIGRADQPGNKVRWNGEGKEQYTGYHLGIAEGPVAKFTQGKGTIGVLMDGWDANPGSGFGHAHHVENGGQRFSWKGKEIPATVFEVAVTGSDLTKAERDWLRE